jgi:hypothetical protein
VVSLELSVFDNASPADAEQAAADVDHLGQMPIKDLEAVGLIIGIPQCVAGPWA